MKSNLAAMLSALLVVAALSACSQSAANRTQQSPEPSSSAELSDALSAPDESPSDTNPAISPSDQPELTTDSGRYSGQADSNFIEIKISGVPEEFSAKVFMLPAQLKIEFDDLALEVGDNIQFEYYVNESGQNVIVSIKKI